MIELTQILSQGFPFVRIDIYEVNDKIYFGEFTFFPGSGFGSLNPKKWNKILGDKLNINYND